MEGAFEIAREHEGARYIVQRDSRLKQIVQVCRWIEYETETGVELRENPRWKAAPFVMRGGKIIPRGT